MFKESSFINLMNSFGQALTLTTKASATYDVTTGTVSSTDTPHTVKGYFYNYDLSDMDANSIRFGDRKLALSSKDTSGTTIPKPLEGDEVSGEGDKVVIVSTREVMSEGSPICYICQVRE